MSIARLVAGRSLFVCGVAAALLLTLGVGPGRAADPFPFDQELLLDVAPMPPVKRAPILSVSQSGNATIDLWCKTVAGRVTFADSDIHIEAGPLPDALPQYMSDGQCTPERMQADADMLAALAQVTVWRRQGRLIVLVGPTPLKFRPSDH
jgi:heat shock protein HslJ